MTTFILPKSDPECTVELTDGLSSEQLLSFPPFTEWISTLRRSLGTQSSNTHTFHDAPYKLRRIHVQAVDFFGGSRIGFLKLQTDVSNDAGEKLPGAVFMRGGSVGMLVGTPQYRCIYCERYFNKMAELLVQFLPAHGQARRQLSFL